MADIAYGKQICSTLGQNPISIKFSSPNRRSQFSFRFFSAIFLSFDIVWPSGNYSNRNTRSTHIYFEKENHSNVNKYDEFPFMRTLHWHACTVRHRPKGYFFLRTCVYNFGFFFIYHYTLIMIL